ncbi:MAG: caspase family protein [Blastocatellia bacterium]
MKKTIPLLCFVLFSVCALGQAPQLVIPVGHNASTGIYDVDVSPDQQLAVSLTDEELKIWEYQSGRLLKTWRHPNKLRYSRCRFTPDGRYILMVGGNAYGGDTQLTVLSTQTLELAREIKPTTGKIGTWLLVVTPDSQWAYTGDFNVGKVQKINLASGEVRQLYDWPNATQVEAISLSPDASKMLVMVAMGKYGAAPFQSALISTADGAALKTLPENEQYQCLTPAGNLLRVESLKNADGTETTYRLTWAQPDTLKTIGQQEIKMSGRYLSSAESLVMQYQFFPKSDRVYFPANKNAFVAAPNESAQQVRIEPRDPDYKRMAVTRDGRQLLLGTGDNRVVQVDIAQKREIREFGTRVFVPIEVVAAARGQAFVVSGDENAAPYLISWIGGHTQMQRLSAARARSSNRNEAAVNISPDGTLVAWGTTRNEVQVADTRTSTKVKKTLTVDDPNHVVISADNKYLIVNSGQKQIFVADIATGTVRPLGTGYFKWGLTDDTGRYFFGVGNSPQNETYAAYFDLQEGKKLWEQTDKQNVLGHYPFFFSAEEVGYVNRYRDFIVLLNRQTGAMRKTSFALENLAANSAVRKRIQALENTVVDGQIVKRAAATGLNDSYALFAKFEDTALKLYRGDGGEKVADLIFAAKSNEWAVVTPDGRFDASEGMLKQLYYTKGRDIIALEALSEKFYTPNLLAQLISAAPEPTPKKDDIKNLKLPPLARITAPVDINTRNLSVEDDTPALRRFSSNTGLIKFTVEANGREDAISEIRLYHNGKLIGSNTRNLSVEDDKLDKNKVQTFEVQLSDGENAFRAVALNTQRTESRPDEIIVVNKAVKAAPAMTTNATATAALYVLVVGINQYKNPKYNLNYANADATAFKTALESHAEGIFSKVNASFVGDAQATRSGIVAELDKIKAAAQPNDVFIFYYAGHGVMSENKQFYMVPHDVTQLYGADEVLAQKGVSTTLMQQYSKEIKAQKQLFILDACQSAAALDQVAMRGAAEEKAIAQLARATGTHWLTASGSEQFASEFKQLGHGTFTYALLEALSGKADRGNDHKITVKELDAYLQEMVPELSAKYRGAPQYPASYGFGNDFPIGIVK